MSRETSSLQLVSLATYGSLDQRKRHKLKGEGVSDIIVDKKVISLY